MCKKVFMSIGIALLMSNCTYRLTNLHVKPLKGIRNLHVLPIEDHSREPLFREQVWIAMQESIISNSHVDLTNREKAEGLVRVTLLSSEKSAIKTSVLDDEKDETELDVVNDPADLRNLGIAGEYATSERISMRFRVEVFSLRTGQRVFSKNYQKAHSFDASKIGSEGIRSETLYPNYHEVHVRSVASIGQSISDQFLGDFVR